MARPELKEHEKKVERYNLRFTTAEDIHIRQQAAAAGITPTEYMRRRALDYRVQPMPSTLDTQLIAEINRIGCNLHQFLRDDRFGRGTRTEADWNELYDRLSNVLEKAAAAYV